jgi:hypothetical protein
MITASVVLAGIVVVAVLAGIVIERSVRARQRRRTVLSEPRRSYELEARIKTVLTGPRQKYGDIFTDYTVWKSDTETRLELVSGPPWQRLNVFTRCLVVRYLWRVLESLAGGAVVIIDQPKQLWNEDVDLGFRDQGFDWKSFGVGPQFVNES